jgi:hypothetical protein
MRFAESDEDREARQEQAKSEHRVNTDGDDRYCEACHEEWPCPTINAWWDAPARSTLVGTEDANG